MIDAMAQLKSFDRDRDGADLDELVAMFATANALERGYMELRLTKPDWLKEAMRAIANEIKERQREIKYRDLQAARNKRDALKAKSETIESLDKTIAALEQELGEGEE